MTLKEIQLKQILILDEIKTICRHIGKSCKCASCQKVRQLGMRYEELSRLRREIRRQGKGDNKIIQIKAKKRDISKADLEYLLIDKWLTQHEVSKYMDLPLTFVKRTCKEYGLSYKYVKQERIRRHEASV